MVRSLFRRKLGLRKNRSSGDKKANGFRLPSEEEWELARRGGDPAKKDFSYSFNGASSPSYDGKASTSADLDKVGWYLYNPSGKTTSAKGSAGTPGFGFRIARNAK